MTDYQAYIDRKVVKETDKAYLVEQEVNNRRDGRHINFRWVAKKLCKASDKEGCVSVPEWIIANGVW